MHWWPIYGALTISTVVGARWAIRRDRRRSADALGAAYALLGTWILTQVSHWWVPHPYNQFFPAMDYMVMVVMALAWRRRFRPWKVCMIALFLAQSIIHAYRAKSGMNVWWYDFWLNRTYEGQLACIWSVVIGVRRDLLRRRVKPM